MKFFKFGWPAVLAPAVLVVAALPAYGTSLSVSPVSPSLIRDDPNPADKTVAVRLVQYEAVPEPGTFLLVGAALVGVGLLKRGRKKDRR